jgi:predicted Rossmann fold flavoprotein
VEKYSKNGFRLRVRSTRIDDHREGRNEANVFSIHTKELLIATGSDRKTLEIVKSLGHSVEDPVPSLFTFNVKDKRIDGLSGVSLENVTLKMDSIVQHGALLITHWGLSGPAVLRTSAWGARELYEKKYWAKLFINWLGETSFDKALTALTNNKEWKENASKKVSAHPAFSQIPSRLWKQLVELVGEKNWADLSKTELRQIAEELTVGEFRIEGKGQFKEEFVTCGGVKLSEVDFKTMQSRIVDGLFFAGEVLNVDGLTGGFNFQSAWTTGWLAGNALVQSFFH